MGEAELAALILRVLARPRRWKAETLGKRIALRDTVRTTLAITTIRPIDATKTELDRRRRERWNEKRRKQTRAAYRV